MQVQGAIYSPAWRAGAGGDGRAVTRRGDCSHCCRAATSTQHCVNCGIFGAEHGVNIGVEDTQMIRNIYRRWKQLG